MNFSCPLLTSGVTEVRIGISITPGKVASWQIECWHIKGDKDYTVIGGTNSVTTTFESSTSNWAITNPSAMQPHYW